MSPHEIGRLTTNLITTGLALREHGLKNLPPSQLIAGTTAAAAGTAYALAGRPLAMDPTLVGASIYALYRAWCTWDKAPHTVALHVGTRSLGGHDALAETVLLAALADAAFTACTAAGAGDGAAVAAVLVPMLWRSAVNRQNDAADVTPLAAALTSLQARIALGVVGTLAATWAAERLGGAPAAVSMSLWMGAQIFPTNLGDDN